MSILLPLILALAPLQDAEPAAVASAGSFAYDFESNAEEYGLAFAATGDGAKRAGVGAKLEDGELVVLEPWWKLDTSAALPAPTAEGARRLDLSFTLTLSPGCEGIGLAWLDSASHGTEGAASLPLGADLTVGPPKEDAEPAPAWWEAPNFVGSLGIGFDARDPWTSEPFRGSGNIHHRPEHEISIHWDGKERFKKLTETDFRDEEPREVQLVVDWVPGGALLDLTLGEEQVFERYFLAGATPYSGRAAFGGRNAETAGWATVDDLAIELEDRFDVAEGGYPAPLEVVAIDRALNDKDAHRTSGSATLPEDLSGYERILMTLRLDMPETRFDPWDRLAHVYVEDERLGKVELLRYITPYHKGHVWTVDVTDLASVLTGERAFEQYCATYGEGWVVSVILHLYPRPDGAEPRPEPYRLERLWEGKCVVGDPAQPPSRFFEARQVTADAETTGAKVRTVVTGHGMSPNTDNAAEFMALGRTLTVNGIAHQNELWKTDNYLNPCRPQGGTWKYDRAGWAPGDVVLPWEVVVPLAGEAIDLGYALAPYVNEGRGQTWDPFHQVTSYLVLYRDAAAAGEPTPEVQPTE